MPPKPSPADELQALPPLACNGKQQWFAKLAPEMQSGLLEIRQRWKRDRNGGKTLSFVFRWCREHLGIQTGYETFRRWIHTDDQSG